MADEKQNTKLEIGPLELIAYRSAMGQEPDRNVMESHIHNQCEIYVNLSGNVSFMVESRVYPIKSGDVIITRPYEAHHCIYHDGSVHDHYCIRFSGENDREVLTPFFRRESGKENMVSLARPHREKLLRLCATLVEEESRLKQYIAFFGLLELLEEQGQAGLMFDLPEDVKLCLDYINANLSRPITVRELAQQSHVTVNTLERHFKAKIGLSPYAYLQNCRLALAVSILEQGGSVTQAAADSGFPDYSHFIALFRKHYGKTPLQFKKER